MAGRFTVWTDFKVGRTDTGKEVRGMDRGLKSLDKTASHAMSTFKGFLGAQFVTRGLSYISMGLQEVTTQFLDFDQSVTSAGARWGDSFDRGTAGFDRLAAAARATGAATEHTSAQAGAGLNFMAMAGFDAAESIGLLPDIANLATAASLDFAASSDIASDAIGAFGMAGGTAEEKISGFKKIVDQATKSTNTSNQTLSMWFEAVREGGPSFTAAGQSMATLNATLGVMANSGKKGATSGYMLRNVINNLAAPSGKAADMLKKMNVQVADKKTGDFRNFIDILGDLEKGLESMGQVERAATIEEIFGKRAVAGMNILLQEGADSLRTYAAEIENSAGASQKVADKMRTSVQGRLKKLQSMALELGFKLFDAFGPKIEKGIERIGQWLEQTNKSGDPLIDTVTDIANGFGDVLGFLVENRTEIAALVKAWLILKTGMVIGSVVTGGISAVNTGLLVMQGNAGMATTGVKSLATTLKTMPTLIMGVTAALSAGLALGDLLWQSLERNRKSAERTANLAYKNAGQMTPGTVEGYSDSNIRKLIKTQQAVKDQDYGIFDLNSDEHDQTKANAAQMLKTLMAEQSRRRVARKRAGNNGLGSGPGPIFGNQAWLDDRKGKAAAAASTVTETKETKEIQHTLKIEDKNKKVTMTPADPGIMP